MFSAMSIQTLISNISLPAKLKRFAERFEPLYGEGHLIFTMHAAFPLFFTPDLLYRIWVNFNVYPNPDEQLSTIDPIAVSDLLLSDFCREVAYEQYELHKEVRTFLLEQLQQDSRFGKV